MKPDLGITQKNLNSVNDLLNKVLADGNVLYVKTEKISLESFRRQFYGTSQTI